MNDVFFTSDTHFGHKFMAGTRAFLSIEEMDEELIANWNNRVGPHDRVYHCGDFSFHDKERTREIISQLNGSIHLIRGNHDKMLNRLSYLFESYQDYKTMRVGDQRIVLFHYAMRVWDRNHYGSWHLYGHSHGNLADDPYALSMDVGVDTNSLYPYSYWEIKELLSRKEFRPVDHHV